MKEEALPYERKSAEPQPQKFPSHVVHPHCVSLGRVTANSDIPNKPTNKNNCGDDRNYSLCGIWDSVPCIQERGSAWRLKLYTT